MVLSIHYFSFLRSQRAKMKNNNKNKVPHHIITSMPAAQACEFVHKVLLTALCGTAIIAWAHMSAADAKY
jgi:hypothetical protein